MFHIYILICMLKGRGKPLHTVGQGSVLLTADQWQATTSFPT